MILLGDNCRQRKHLAESDQLADLLQDGLVAQDVGQQLFLVIDDHDQYSLVGRCVFSSNRVLVVHFLALFRLSVVK
jgi:hypothetical protein